MSGVPTVDTHTYFSRKLILDVLAEEGPRFNVAYRAADNGFYIKTEVRFRGPLPYRIVYLEHRIAGMDAQGTGRGIGRRRAGSNATSSALTEVFWLRLEGIEQFVPRFGLDIIQVLSSFVEVFPRMSQKSFHCGTVHSGSGAISIVNPGETLLHSPGCFASFAS